MIYLYGPNDDTIIYLRQRLSFRREGTHLDIPMETGRPFTCHARRYPNISQRLLIRLNAKRVKRFNMV